MVYHAKRARPEDIITPGASYNGIPAETLSGLAGEISEGIRAAVGKGNAGDYASRIRILLGKKPENILVLLDTKALGRLERILGESFPRNAMGSYMKAPEPEASSAKRLFKDDVHDALKGDKRAAERVEGAVKDDWPLMRLFMTHGEIAGFAKIFGVYLAKYVPCEDASAPKVDKKKDEKPASLDDMDEITRTFRGE